METQRLKVKIGPHEFEAEGPPESVAAQFEAWQSLVTAMGGASPKEQEPQDNANANDRQTSPGELPNIFKVDRAKRFVTLRVFPATGERRDADALLLILYGYKQA